MKRFACVALLLAACGGSDDRVAAFQGTWMYLAGSTSTLDCQNNQLDMTLTLSGNFMFAAGTASDIVDVPDADDTCPALKLDVSGSTASAQSGQGCTEMGGTAPNTYTAMTTINQYTAMLDGPGTKMTITAQAAVTFTGAIATTCTVAVTGSAMKVTAREDGETGNSPSRALIDMTRL